MRIALVVLAALIAGQEPARTPIWWSLKKGQIARYEFNHRLVSGEKDRTQEAELTLVIVLEGGDLGADRANAVTLTFERIALIKAGDGEREDYDSARDKEPPAGSYPRVLSKCVGKSVSFRIAASGSFTAIEDLRTMVQDAVDAYPDLKGRSKWDADGVKVVARRLEWLLRLGLETPKGGPAAVGDTWETKYESEDVTRGVGKAVCRSRLKELKPGEAQIEQTVKFDFDAPYAAAIKEASGKGALVWDTERGMLKTLGTTSKFVTLKGDATHTVTVALLKDAPAK
ncbi:MAG TPA: hypothetical protein VFS19_07325 [Planctomycetota bacterium]|nr:hypothetical protein [Planctomycetota bacterium]